MTAVPALQSPAHVGRRCTADAAEPDCADRARARVTEHRHLAALGPRLQVAPLERRRHGLGGRRATVCSWCGEPLVYLSQDKFPGVRQFCDHRCARQAWVFERAKQRTTVTKALGIAVRKLQGSRMLSMLAASWTIWMAR